MANQKTIKYPGVYIDDKGRFFYQSEFGTDKITGKRIRKKGRKDRNGKPIYSNLAANKELTRLKREYHKVNSYSNYKMMYEQFIREIYIPYYKTEVEESTFSTKEAIFSKLIKRFGDIQLRNITIEDVQNYRTYILTDKESGGEGFS